MSRARHATQATHKDALDQDRPTSSREVTSRGHANVAFAIDGVNETSTNKHVTYDMDQARDEDILAPEKHLKTKRPLIFWKKLLKTAFVLVSFALVIGSITANKLIIVFITSNLVNTAGVSKFVVFAWTKCPPRFPGAENITGCGLPYCGNHSSLGEEPLMGVRWFWCLAMCIVTPYFVVLIRCSRHLLFKKTGQLVFRPTLLVFVIETCHTIGLMILLYQCLPLLDGSRAILLMTGVGLVPAIGKMIRRVDKNKNKNENENKNKNKNESNNKSPNESVNEYKNDDKSKAYIKMILDIIAIVIQFSAVLFFPIFTAVRPLESNLINCEKYPASIIRTENLLLPESISQFWPVPLALVMISLSYWENFVTRDIMINMPSLEKHDAEASGSPQYELKAKIHDTRAKINVIVYSWKVVLTFCLLFPLFIWKYPGKGIGELFTSDNFYFDPCNRGNNLDKWFQVDWLIVYSVHAFVSFVGYYTAVLAVKAFTQLQVYSLSLTLATPTAISIVYWACDSCESFSVLGTFSFFNCLNGWDSWVELANQRWTYIGFFWWLSQLWITKHLWAPSIERMARTSRILINPGYCGALFEQSLAYNRRSHDGGKREANGTNVGGVVPTVKLCATMWHESKEEMTKMLTSIFRLDFDFGARKLAFEELGKDFSDQDKYEFEGHVFFDNAFNKDDGKINEYVRELTITIKEASSAYYPGDFVVGDPLFMSTPYGARLVYELEAKNKLIIHLKDKKKIRIKKRWSQVMYMYYFLDDDLWGQCDRQRKKEIMHQRKNTYLLALDGDVDFNPQALLHLIDLMKRNPKVGASCGRIHPIGSGPMVWYQKFEYSIGHWLQKATEHVLGCVLCSPGCFSLFRGSDLFRVMKTYTREAKEARQIVQYDQGEDRWLCTLLLQKGCKVEYTAAADAFTYAPEGFNEFFNQRKRWAPSTMSNIMDLLETSKKTVKENDNISRLYMLYQGTIFVTSILGPGTIFMLLVGALQTTYLNDLGWISFLLIFLPMLAFVIASLTVSSKTQLQFAFVLSVITFLLQFIVAVGLAVMLSEYGLCNPASWILVWVAGVFVLAALIHPEEGLNILYFPVYFIAIPSMYLILIIYSYCNLNNTSWGTREGSNENKGKDNQNKKGLFKTISESCSGCCAPTVNINGLDDLLKAMTVIKKDASTDAEPPPDYDTEDTEDGVPETNTSNSDVEKNTPKKSSKTSPPEPWTKEEIFKKENKRQLESAEKNFWDKLIELHLSPPKDNPTEEEQKKMKEEETKMKKDLKDLRNWAVLVFFMFNAVFILLISVLEAVEMEVEYECTDPVTGKFHENLSVGAITISFAVIFGLVLLLQTGGMLMHRLFTMLQVISTTKIRGYAHEAKIDEAVNKIKAEAEKNKNKDWKQVVKRETMDKKLNKIKRSHTRKTKRHPMKPMAIEPEPECFMK